jgi:hypothetical protein
MVCEIYSASFYPQLANRQLVVEVPRVEARKYEQYVIATAGITLHFRSFLTAFSDV